MARWIYAFGEGGRDDRQLLGGKGANLAEMTRVGLPVPPGFTITTEACRAYSQAARTLPAGLEEELWARLAELERKVGRRFGDDERPLLVSVRSGAPVSMPGMMDTVLNLGLNRRSVRGLAAMTGNERFAYDSYRRFIQMFANVVKGQDLQVFERLLEEAKAKAGVTEDRLLPADALAELAETYRATYERLVGEPFPQDPREQLLAAVKAVFDSWDNPRAKVYRRVHGIPDDLGTAVNVQAMVFGNLGDTSGTGVLFTRNPNTGERVLYGEYLLNAQGEDVVAGIRTPKPIAELRQEIPAAYEELSRLAQVLEDHYRDMQDIEFTIEEGRVFLLQTRAGKRSARAAVAIAVALAEEGRISVEEALRRVTPDQVAQLLHRTVDPSAEAVPIAKGLPASPGAAVGRIAFTADDAERMAKSGQPVLLVRPETAPDDIHGIVAAAGVLTSRGGMTCHAAIVARGMGKPCVVGCDALRIDVGHKVLRVGEHTLGEGDVLSIDGATGRVFLGEVPMVEPGLGGEVAKLLAWADERRRLGVRANADTPVDARRAREFGAEGIGLCRTEHMFMDPARLPVVQEMILAETAAERERALEKLRPMQEGDFYEILLAMDGRPVTIRLLDPPLHEFLPNVEELAVEVAVMRAQGQEGSPAYRERHALLRRARELSEANPMLGFRGCRLGIVYPEIYAMQCRAIFGATRRLLAEGRDPRPEVMVPLVGDPKELERLTGLIREVEAEVLGEAGRIPVGTMIEIPRAALLAGEIARTAEFFSFGTNDLTQTTFGFSRDDAEAKFLHRYVEEGILAENPFMVLDRDGVGRLVRIATAEGRAARAGLKAGICGEHGGDPSSIAFCHEVGLDYVSCSPFRVPVARLAAAQAALS
jgi:pyruvate,orthophosphate dikinase